MSDSVHKGDIGEAIITADLLKRGYKVFKPVSSDSKFDLLATTDNHIFYRVQCKYTAGDGKNIRIQCRRSTHTNLVYRYTPAMIDWLAIYDASLDKCFYVPATILGENGRNELRLRITPSRHHRATAPMASNYINPPIPM